MLYEKIYNFRNRKVKSSLREAQYERLVHDFQSKIETLPRPVVRPEDLIGWQRLVYANLPEGPFRTRDLYRFEEEFRNIYPKNQHIRAKIRQVLQELRDLHLIKYVEKETWVKI